MRSSYTAAHVDVSISKHLIGNIQLYYTVTLQNLNIKDVSNNCNINM
jgi:type VI protein secretion system component Hcp